MGIGDRPKQSTKKAVWGKIILIALLVVVIIILSIVVMFRQDGKSFSEGAKDYYQHLKITDQGIQATEEETSSLKMPVIIQNAVAANTNSYNRVASIGLSSVQQVAGSNIMLDVANLNLNQSILQALSTISTSLPTSEKAKETADSITNLSRYIKDSKTQTKEEKLEYLLNAEAVTRFPYIKSIADDETKVNGIIKFKRYTTQIENTSEPREYELTYVTETRFDSLYQQYENSGNREVFKYFTINQDQDVVIAGGVETVNTITTNDAEVTESVINSLSTDTYVKQRNGEYKSVKYQATRQEIDYKSLTENYVLPFNFLATVLIQTRDYKFVKELADLAYDSEVVIGIYDNESVSTNIDTYTYNKYLEYTESTELNLSGLGITVPTNNVLTYCKGILTSQDGQTTIQHQIPPGYNGGSYECDETLYTSYISGLTGDGKISSTSGEAYAFETKRKTVITSNSTATKGVILADVWAGKWTATYKGDTTDTSQDGAGTLSDEQPQAITADKFTTEYYSSNIVPLLTTHSERVKAEAIRQIVQKEEAAGTFDEHIDRPLTYSYMKQHAIGCSYCINTCIAFEVCTNARDIRRMTVEEFIQLIEEKGIYGNILNCSNAALQREIRAEEEAKKQENKQNFKENLERNMTYSQTVVAQKANKNIQRSSNYAKTTTIYSKDSTETDNIGKKFKKIFNKEKYHETVKAILLRSTWFWESIQEHEDTAKLENVIRYMFNIATNSEEFGIFTDDDIETLIKMFEPQNSTSFGALYGNTVEEKVWCALRNAGYSEIAAAGAMGNLEKESGFSTNNLQNSYETSLGYSDDSYTQAVDSGAYTREQFVHDSAGYGLAQWTYYSRKAELYDYAKEKGVSIADADMQIEFLLAELTPGGNGIATYQLGTPRRGYSADDWKNAESVSEATSAFCWVFENPGTPDLAGRIAFSESYYQQYQGKTFFNGNIFEVCKEVMNTFLNRNTVYSTSTGLIYGDIERCYNEADRICCATYVSMVLYRAGILSADHINKYNYHYTGTGAMDKMLGDAGWTQLPLSELQPGDVLLKRNPGYGYGHVMIYAGDNQCWDQNCCAILGGNNYLGRTVPYSQATLASDGYEVWRQPGSSTSSGAGSGSGDAAGANQLQQKIVQVASQKDNFGKAQGYCLGWVCEVYRRAGAPYSGSCCARCSGNKYSVSKDFSAVPIGACIYGYSDYDLGVYYGHVGIYVGNGKVAHLENRVIIESLDSWKTKYTLECWGWAGGTPVNNAYPINPGLINKGVGCR